MNQPLSLPASPTLGPPAAPKRTRVAVTSSAWHADIVGSEAIVAKLLPLLQEAAQSLRPLL